MRVLFDQSTPVPIRPFLAGHNVRTAAQERWETLKNGELLSVAQAAVDSATPGSYTEVDFPAEAAPRVPER